MKTTRALAGSGCGMETMFETRFVIAFINDNAYGFSIVNANIRISFRLTCSIYFGCAPDTHVAIILVRF